MQRLTQTFFITLLLAVTACGQRTDPNTIEGHWVADNFRIQGIKLPIGPDLFISKDSLGFGTSLTSVQLNGIGANGSEVTLKTQYGLDIVFAFENNDRMYFTVPFSGDRIYYQRADETKTAAVSLATAITSQGSIQASAATQVQASTERFTSTVAVPALAPAAPSRQAAVVPKQESYNQGPDLHQQPAFETQYQQALAALRQGDEDASLRSLSAALSNGFTDWRRIEQESLFGRLRNDIRFQVLQSRWKNG